MSDFQALTRVQGILRDERSERAPGGASGTIVHADLETSVRHTSQPQLTYLISCYPAITHTFILREILALRELGCIVRTVSIKSPERSSDGLTSVEEAERQQTFYVKGRGLRRIAWDHLKCFTSRPLRYLAGLWFTVRLCGLAFQYLPNYLLYFAEAIVVGEWMRRKDLDHLHVHFANAGSTVALIISKVYPVQYSMTVHGPDEFYAEVFYRLKEKTRGASFICCISQFCRGQLMKASSIDDWHKFEVCPLGVDPNWFHPGQAPVEQEFGVCCVGRLVAAKGQAVLLEAAAALLNRGKRVHVHLIGDGPDRKALQELIIRHNITENVTFHGSVNQDRLRSLLAEASVFVLPSFAEGVPVSLMEAMAMEIPCISTVTAGIPELISSGVNGILVPPSDAASLAEALEMLIGNPEYRLKLGRAGRRKIMEQYNLQDNARRLACVFARRLAVRSDRT
jgi:colanic acid/amylovoran biosynthesis glycosyltransferase